MERGGRGEGGGGREKDTVEACSIRKHILQEYDTFNRSFRESWG